MAGSSPHSYIMMNMMTMMMSHHLVSADDPGESNRMRSLYYQYVDASHTADVDLSLLILMPCDHLSIMHCIEGNS